MKNERPALIKRRTKEFTKPYKGIAGGKITVSLRYDDSCNNGVNTFAITANVTTRRGKVSSWGCLHEEIKEYFPEFTDLIPYHLCSDDGPLHYVANTLYHAGISRYSPPPEPNIEYARKSAIWPEATIEQLRDKEALLERLPGLIAEFHAKMREAGLLE